MRHAIGDNVLFAGQPMGVEYNVSSVCDLSHFSSDWHLGRLISVIKARLVQPSVCRGDVRLAEETVTCIDGAIKDANPETDETRDTCQGVYSELAPMFPSDHPAPSLPFRHAITVNAFFAGIHSALMVRRAVGQQSHGYSITCVVKEGGEEAEI
jgi:hypothetical protein